MIARARNGEGSHVGAATLDRPADAAASGADDGVTASLGARIAFEASSLLVRSPSGVGVFGTMLVDALRGRGAASDFHLLYRVGRRRVLPLGSSLHLPMQPYLWGTLLHRRFPLIHALDTRLPPGYRGRVVATLFDVLSALPMSRDLRLSPHGFRAKKLAQYRFIAERADTVISISEATRRSFVEAFGGSGRHVVIHPGVSPAFEPAAYSTEALERYGLLHAPYVLFVGELCRRKNLEAVVEVFTRVRATTPRLRLVLVGRPSYGWEGSRAERLVRRNASSVRTLGFVPFADLAALYAGARALLFLSHYEGFGLPVLEAMASGVPVVASCCGGIPEAAGDAAALVPPGDLDAAEAALRRVVEDPSEAAEHSRRGLARAAAFTWERAAAGVEAVYAEALGR